MASIYQLKPAFQELLRPIMARLVEKGITPNQVTLAAIGLSALGGLMVIFSLTNPWLLVVVPVLLFVRMAMNALDGMMARSENQTSRLGEVLNEVGDVVSDALLYGPFIVYVSPDMMGLLILGSFIVLTILTEFCGVLAKSMTGFRRYDGPMGKSDRAFAMAMFSLALYVFPLVMVFFNLIFLFFDGLLIVSCRNRIRAILQTSSSGS